MYDCMHVCLSDLKSSTMMSQARRFNPNIIAFVQAAVVVVTTQYQVGLPVSRSAFEYNVASLKTLHCSCKYVYVCH